ncbi:O-antigen ligase family protein [Ferribacterium limneticum]|uniref:O-antigen ligase family protein n=1 Tax=Ferribacterium limneticum TaxID=76259 RepID=UPI001CF91A63|nr:O-antigen ligase family protein [Ferribacterium limneticum]UCV22126.1 O-antigen ligase family protein [Ferribacterium limneticum]
MKSKALSIIVAFSALIAGLVILVAHPDLTWHDQQRLGQIAISVLSFAGVFLLRYPRVVVVNPVWLWPAVSVLVIGALSAAFASHPWWAATEVALLVACIGISAFVFRLMREYGDRADLVLGSILRLLLAGMVFQFYVSFVSALAHAELFFSPWSLLYGFSNVRFEGQFLTIAVPLLGGTLCMPKDSSVRYPRRLDFFLMLSLASMVFVAGTRGTIAAWLAVSIMFWGLKEGARNTAKRMFLVMALGFVLAWLVLQTVSWVTGQPADYRFAGEQVFGLSAREILWQHAWAKIVEFPWFGVGPMHFASLGNPVGSHPHQSLLQIASEWGLPVFFMIMATVAVWLFKVFAEVRSGDAKMGAGLRWVLLFAVLSSMVQSMVDGVLVMPYPQLWLAITVGWCSARCLPRVQGGEKRIPGWLPLVLWGVANLLLIAVAVKSYPDLVGAAEYCGGGPRFWCNGRI